METITFQNGERFQIDRLSPLPRQNQVIVVLLNTDFAHAYALFSDKNRTMKITHNDGKYDAVYRGYTRIISLSQDENGDAHVWLEKEG